MFAHANRYAKFGLDTFHTSNNGHIRQLTTKMCFLGVFWYPYRDVDIFLKHLLRVTLQTHHTTNIYIYIYMYIYLYIYIYIYIKLIRDFLYDVHIEYTSSCVIFFVQTKTEQLPSSTARVSREQVLLMLGICSHPGWI